ncbi:hypothetical protein D9758_014193 [Tetrapyrgos nigripes]|uniref:NmrA-like domain-containing protein n=1 Tax=Tetrapyrgos nigripes TaxID=182062 RepID=A0A8H5FNU0_9AGAR|nr:hypothetical protein D9758_014193 [Tetrapyrgos nigripes]
MTDKTKILITGITGYIGGSVFSRFLKRPDFSSFDIRAIVRSAEKGEKLKNLYGVTPIVGSHSDFSLMENAASEADIVLSMANVDDVDAARATLSGLKKKFEKTGKKGVFINTSGTAVLADNARGEYPGETIYDDADADQIESLSPSQPHRPVDIEIVTADKEGYVDTYIIIPPLIWGKATGRPFDDGLAHGHSFQIPWLVNAAVKRGRAGFIGKGANIWPHVEVHELVEVYSILLDNVLPDSKRPAIVGHGRNGYYFASMHELNFHQVASAIGSALVEAGKGKDAEPTAFTEEEVQKYFGEYGYPVFGSNSRCKTTRMKELGWSPQKDTKDMLNSIRGEVDASIAANSNKD